MGPIILVFWNEISVFWIERQKDQVQILKMLPQEGHNISLTFTFFFNKNGNRNIQL